MPMDPFVVETLDTEPRNHPNLAPGVQLPPADGWTPDRPADLGASQPRGGLYGTPGPNIGYGLTLTRRSASRMQLQPHEHSADAQAVVSEIAMKRATVFGRAPVMVDVEFAMELMGYTGAAPEDVSTWRPDLVRESAHEYAVRRAVVDQLSPGLLRLSLAELPEHLAIVREAMARAALDEAAQRTATGGSRDDAAETQDAGGETNETGAAAAAPSASGEESPSGASE